MGHPLLVVLGASGFLGQNLLRAAAGETVVAVSRTPQAQTGSGRVHWIGVDGWATELRRLRERGPVSVIHSLALTDHAYCEQHPEEAMEINAGSAAAAARICRELDVPLIYVSTDGIFPNLDPAGSPRYWALSDVPAPVSAYGRSKLEAERVLAELRWGHAVRMSFVGRGLRTGRGLITFLAERLRSAKSVPGFTDVWFTPAPSKVATERLVALAVETDGGYSIRQWGCYPALTKYDLLAEVARAAGFTPRMEPCLRSSLPGAATVQMDQSLACEDPWTRQELIKLSAQALLDELAATG